MASMPGRKDFFGGCSGTENGASTYLASVRGIFFWAHPAGAHASASVCWKQLWFDLGVKFRPAAFFWGYLRFGLFRFPVFHKVCFCLK